MPKFTVYYTYAADGYVTIKADSQEEAELIVERAWDSGILDRLNPVSVSAGDFEVLYTKKRQPPKNAR